MSDFNKAIKWLIEGKGIKRTNWRIDGEVHLILKEVNGENKVFDSYGKEYKFEYDDIITKKWMIYKKKFIEKGVKKYG